MESIVQILQTLNTLSPIGVIALLALVLYNMSFKSTHKQVETIADNHLHELPVMKDSIDALTESIESVNKTLQRIEVSQSENFAHIRARINGNYTGGKY